MSNNSQKEITPDEFSKKKSPVLLENKQNLQDSESIKEKVAQEEAEDFYLLVSIYGSILKNAELLDNSCLLYTSPSPRDQRGSRMPSSA